MIVAIDGPASSGKSTTARLLAGRLGWLYLDTGAMYRAVALAFLRTGTEATPEAAARLLPDVRVDVAHDARGMRVLLNDEEVAEAIREPAVAQMASRISAFPSVRQKLLAAQRRAGHAHADPGVVLDGRDIGTVVFPEADLKIFMVADAAVRARRRYEELRARGVATSFEDVLADLQQRDRHDRERAVAPLRKAADAVELDTTHRSVDEQVAFILQQIRERSSGRDV